MGLVLKKVFLQSYPFCTVSRRTLMCSLMTSLQGALLFLSLGNPGACHISLPLPWLHPE